MSKKDNTIPELIDALADVIAYRAARMVTEAGKPPKMPERVPVWLSPADRPKHRRRPPIEGPWTPEKVLRNAGLLRMGDPGYEELLAEHLVAVRAHEAELRCRAQARRAARLLTKLMAKSGSEDRAQQ
jgi:hypothetical protein